MFCCKKKVRKMLEKGRLVVHSFQVEN